MRPRTRHLFYTLIAITLFTCKQPYTPLPITNPPSYLVVEGFINIADSTHIILSRTLSISKVLVTNIVDADPELKATISIESNTGGSYPITEIGNGIYGGPNYHLSATNQYRIRIKTSNGSIYSSAFEQATIAPPIDTLKWADQGNGVQVSLNAHGSPSSTHYYLWDYRETWEIYTFYISPAVYDPKTRSLAIRTPAQQVSHCWGTDRAISLNSTTMLSQDIIQNQGIVFLPIGTEKLSWEYSIIVNQYALTKEGYNYYSLLKKNTEQLGSIFDVQPTSSGGNIQNVSNANEPVVGFIGAGTVSSTRIFINRFTQLPNVYYADYYTNSPYTQLNACVPIIVNLSTYAIVPEIAVPGGTGAYEPAGCADCTINGGTNVKPTFMP